jgi:Fe-S-cluster containining protein
MEEAGRLKKKILEEYPRLKEADRFAFACSPGVSCFTKCCADVNIVLSPYDVLRLRQGLGRSSREILDEHTVTIGTRETQVPVVMLKMRDDDSKACPFVSAAGCGIYDARPWPCRMYPLGLASPSVDHPTLTEAFYFLMREDVCRGFAECADKEWTVLQWLDDQGLAEYNRMGELWKEVTLHRFFLQGGMLSPEQLDMLYLAAYDLDRFRQFVFESSFLRKFEVDDATVAAIKTDDVALLEFAMRWLKFALFREPTMTVREPIASLYRKATGADR